jgi:prolyl-tRNA synthetase
MRLSQLIGERYREQPSEAVLKSHSFLLKGGYIRQVSNGIFSMLPPAKRISDKIEQLIREEMDQIDGQEVRMPVLMPRELWEESGRYQSIGAEMFRLKDRTGHDYVLGMTHEEAVVHLCRKEVTGHQKMPFMVYQIQTKLRDEPRSRGGLIRVREFIMKDAYSFHTTQEDLDVYYNDCHAAYERIFKRAGIPQVVSVKSDTGMMGGSVAHEFMLLCDAGEDTIVLCENCDYKANMEVATGILPNQSDAEESIEEIHTPGITSIEDLSQFLKVETAKIVKAVVLGVDNSDKQCIVFIRGDMEINEAKLKAHLQGNILPVPSAKIENLMVGYIGPLGIDTQDFIVLVDASLKNAHNMVCGANRKDTHLKGFSFPRDFKEADFVDVSKVKDGSLCTRCHHGKLRLERGIEVGNIFQLGTKYSKAMNMKYTAADGTLQYPIMGCYGIGVGRLMASVLEVHSDEFGPIWPISISPWQVHICAIRIDKPEIRQWSEKVYRRLLDRGFQVILDDRDVSTGVQFADADLLGIPIRLVLSPRNWNNQLIELTTRDKTFKKEIKEDSLEEEVQALVHSLYKKIHDGKELPS